MVQYILLFLEGIMAFLSPCHLPLLPAFLSFFSTGESNAKKTLKNAYGFVLGFTLVFVVLGAFAGTLGILIRAYIDIINIIAGIIIIFLGLDFLGIIHLHIFGHGKHREPHDRKVSFFSALIFGAAFSITWTPCAGAFILSALTMASLQGGVFSGVIMLLSFSLGLGLPYIMSALLIDKLKGTFAFLNRNQKKINIVSGILLILIGLFIATGMMEVLMDSLGWHEH